MKRILSIELNEDLMKVDILRKKYKNLYIEKSFEVEASINHLKYKDSIEGSIRNIKDNLELYGYSYKYLNFNIQNESTVVRNIKILGVKRKKDILGMIEFEINQYLPINVKDYCIKYKVLKRDGDYLNLQVVLMPKYIIKICNDIGKGLGIKVNTLSVNLNILEKLINLNLIDNLKEDSVVIEEKSNYYILNKLKGGLVNESYYLNKDFSSEDFIEKVIKESENVFYYGDVSESELKDYEEQLIPIKIKYKVHIDSGGDSQTEVKFINSIGMVV